MTDVTITWTEELAPCITTGATVPVVRLEQVDALIGEAVWAMTRTLEFNLAHDGNREDARRARSFLASPLVQAWRERHVRGRMSGQKGGRDALRAKLATLKGAR